MTNLLLKLKALFETIKAFVLSLVEKLKALVAKAKLSLAPLKEWVQDNKFVAGCLVLALVAVVLVLLG